MTNKDIKNIYKKLQSTCIFLFLPTVLILLTCETCSALIIEIQHLQITAIDTSFSTVIL